MSNRSERREADRLARRLAFLQLRQQTAAEQVPPAPEAGSPAISEAQLHANRSNAQLSTGPITPEGKAISALNNTRHGLSSEADGEDFRVLGDESQSAYDQSLAGYRKEWKPITATENDLVNRLVMHQWLRRRALRLQKTVFNPQTGEITDIKKFDLYRRYETQHERGYNKALADILKLRAFQLRQQNGFESQARKNAEHEVKMRRLNQREGLGASPSAAKSPAQTPPSARENPMQCAA